MQSCSLETLLERWSEARAQGLDVPAVELCGDRTELVEELARRMAEYEKMSALVRQLAVPPLQDPHRTMQPQMTPGSPPLPSSLPTLVRRPGVEGPADVPGYQIVRELGRGGMGIVYLARDLELDRLVALKMLLDSARVGAEAVARFRQEAMAVARLSHPGTVQIYNVGEVWSASGTSRPYMAMEYCAGGTLQEKLAGKPLPAREAARIVEALARTMHAVHGARVVHRDLKPGNVLLQGPTHEGPTYEGPTVREGAKPATGALPHGRAFVGAPKIADFGLAKRLDGREGTLSGLILGTPSYMAPEQAEGRTRDVGPLADVWALGAILYECLTGRPPFLGSSVLETLQQVGKHDPVPPRELNPSCPRDLETIALKCLQKDRAKRYASAEALADDLARFRERRPILARPAGVGERLARWVMRCPFQAACGLSVLVTLVAVVVALLLHLGEQRRVNRLRDDFTNRVSDAEEKASRAKPEDREAWDAIKADLQSALDGIAKEAAFRDSRRRRRAEQLRDQALDMVARHRIRDEARGKLERGWRLHAEAVFFGQLAAGLDLPESQARARGAIREALQLFAVKLDGDGPPDIRDSAPVCHELLLLDADLVAKDDPTGARTRRDRAARLGVRESAGEPFRAALEHYRREEFAPAEKALASALKREPKHHGAQYLRAVCLLHLDQPAQASETLRPASDRGPDLVWTKLLRGHAAMQLGHHDEARREFDAASRDASDPLAEYVVRVNRGVLAMKRRAWAEATADFRHAIARRPEALPAYVNLALTHRQSVAWPAWQTAVVGLSPFALLAVEVHRRGALAEAVAALDAAIERHPAAHLLYHERGRLHLARDDAANARDDLARAVALASAAGQTATLADDLLELGRLLHRSGQHAKAVETFRQAQGVAPKQVLAHRLIAEPLVALGRYREAGEALDGYLGAIVVAGRPITADDATRLARTLEARGLIHVHQGDFRSAIDVYTQSLKLARDAGVLRLRGWAYLKLGSARLAEADFADAVALAPEHPEAYLGRAESRVRLGQVDRALSDVEQGLRREPMTPRLLFNAARVRGQAAQQLPRPGAKTEEVRAARLLDRALNLLPAKERRGFWKSYVEADGSLATVRLHPLLSKYRP